MAKRIKNYLAYVDELLSRDDLDFDKEIEWHLKQIAFYAHERLVHLIVMFLFAIGFVISVLAFIMSGQISIFAIALSLLVLLVPYLKHYYLLENSVQRMYEQYDMMMKKAGHKAFINKDAKQ